ncbi:MAG: DUF2240 family protein [Methanomassiliicoccales archaeon]
MDNLKRVVAMVFKRKGKGVLTEKEFVFSASIDFRWFTPKEAQRLLEKGIEGKLLVRTNGFVKPSFDYKEVDIPMDFKPEREMLDAGEEVALFPRILNRISEATGSQKREVVARINKMQERLEVDIEVAALTIAREMDVEMGDLISPVEEEILER